MVMTRRDLLQAGMVGASVIGLGRFRVSEATTASGAGSYAAVYPALDRFVEQYMRDMNSPGMTLVLAGLAIGAIGAYQLTHLMSTLLFSIEPTDPLTFSGVSIILIIAAAIACFVPARRVTRIDPMLALRSE